MTTSPRRTKANSPLSSPTAVRQQGQHDAMASIQGTSPQQQKASLGHVELPAISTMSGFAPFGTPTAAKSNAGLLSPLANGATTRAGSSGAGSPFPNGSLSSNLIPSSPPLAQPLSSPTDSILRDTSPGPWSAIGHAGTTGKSGRVIERLMTENDRLRRELNAHTVKSEEIQRSLQTCKPQIDALRTENDNLSHARSVDAGLITRRDRRIEELRAELKVERERRDAAEKRSRQLDAEKEAMAEETRREVHTLSESTRHAVVHAEIMETSHKQLAQEYRTRAEGFRRDLQKLHDTREADRQKLLRLEVVYEQMRQELERHSKLKNEIIVLWERLKEEERIRLEAINDEVSANNIKNQQLSEAMEQVVGEMRWLMGVRRAQHGPAVAPP